MNEIFKTVLCLSLSGTVTILGIFLLCRIFQRKLSRRWQYSIWLVAVIRLLVPFSGEVNLMGHAFVQMERYAGQTEIQSTEEETGGADKESDRAISESGGAEREYDSVRPDAADTEDDGNFQKAEGIKEIWNSELPGMIWITAAVLLLVWRIAAYRRFAGSIRAGSTPADLELLEQFGRIMEEIPVRGMVELYTNPYVSSPLLAGWIRPMVILPAKEWSKTDLRYTLLHELIHYRRKDVLYKWLVQLAVCLHWFNPFVWFLGREVDRACELACDEAVLEKLAADERKAYGDTLLRAADPGSVWKHHIGAVTLHESGRLLKGRLEAIMRYRKHTKWRKVLSLTLTVIIAAGAAALGAYAEPGAAGENELRFTGGGNDFLLSDGTSVIERDDIFYILCDGITEEKVPLAGVVDGTMIMVVHRDLHRSVILSTSVTLSDDRSYLLEEAEEICQDMQARGTLSAEDAVRILETAKEVQKRAQSVPQSAFFDGNYYQSAYYQAPYLFFIGYNLTEEAVQQYAGTEIILEDGEQLYVSFADSSREWMKDEEFLKVLCDQFSEFRGRTGKRVSGIRRPIVSNVEAVGYDAEELTAGYYAADDMGRFSVLLEELTVDRRKEYLEKAFQENDAAVLAIVLGSLDRSGLLPDDELIGSFISRAYENGEVAFFSILADYMSRELQQEWYAKLEREAEYSPCRQILREHLSNTGGDPEDKWEEDDQDNW